MKKLIFFLISFLIIINGVVASEKEKIYIGDKIPGMYIQKVDKTGKITNKQGGFLRRVSDNQFVYCLEPFILLIDYYEYQEYNDNYLDLLNISKEDWEYITLIAYYGYMYNNHYEDYWYYVTQMMIWRVVDKEAQFYFTDYLGGAVNNSLYKDEIAEIEYLVKMHKTLPKISNITVNYGDEIIISDNNNVLNNFKVVNSDIAEIRGNNLIIKGSKIGNYTINLVRENTYYDDSLLVYIDSESQKVMSAGNVKSQKYSFNVNVSGGKIIVNKKDFNTKENLNMAGIKFLLYDEFNKLVNTLATNENGVVIFDNLKVGKYYLSEDNNQEILGYIVNDEIIEINITDSEDVIIDFYNKEAMGSIKIIKYQEIFDKEINLELKENVEFGLYDMSNNLIMKKVTDKNGIIIFDNLKIGKYKVKELNNDEDYINNNNYIEIEVKLTTDNVGSEEIVQVTNELKKGKLIIKKIGDDNLPLKDTEFTIYNIDGTEIYNSLTNNNGEIIVNNLPLGDYYIKETKASPGYQVLNDKIYFKISDNEEVITINVTNEKIIVKVPNTEVEIEEIILFMPKKRFNLN